MKKKGFWDTGITTSDKFALFSKPDDMEPIIVDSAKVFTEYSATYINGMIHYFSAKIDPNKLQSNEHFILAKISPFNGGYQDFIVAKLISVNDDTALFQLKLDDSKVG